MEKGGDPDWVFLFLAVNQVVIKLTNQGGAAGVWCRAAIRRRGYGLGL